MIFEYLKNIEKGALYSIFSRALSSIGTFLISLYLIKNLTVSSYGIYSSIFGISVLIAGLVTSIFTTQMIAITSKKNNSEINYLSIEYYYMQNIVFLTLMVLSYLLIFFNAFDEVPFNEYLIIFSLLIAWGVASKDVLTSRSFLIKDNEIPLSLNVASLIVLILYLLVNQNFLNENKIYGLELPILYFVIFMFLYLISKGLPLFKLKKTYFVYAREALKNGKWAFLQSISRYFRTQSYILAALLLLGVYEIGFVNSVLIYVLPITVLYSALSQYFLPKISIGYERGEDIEQKINHIIYFLIGSFFLYSLIILNLKDNLNTLIFRNEIIENSYFNTILYFWLIISLIQGINTILFMECQSKKMFKYLAVVSGASAILSLVLAIIGIKFFGLLGLMCSMLFVEIFILVVLLIQKISKIYA